MTSSNRRTFITAIAASFFAGCGPEQVPLAKVPETAVPPAVDPKTLPRNSRPPKNSSAGLDHPPNQ